MSLTNIEKEIETVFTSMSNMRHQLNLFVVNTELSIEDKDTVRRIEDRMRLVREHLSNIDSYVHHLNRSKK